MLSIKYTYIDKMFEIPNPSFSEDIFINILTEKQKFFFENLNCSTCVGRSLRLFLSKLQSSYLPDFFDLSS